MTRNYENLIAPNDNYVLINGVPLNRQMVFKDFLESSEYEFDSFDFFTDDYNLKISACVSDDKELFMHFDSMIPYDSKGGGHITIRGEFMPDSTKPVDEIILRYKKKNTNEN